MLDIEGIAFKVVVGVVELALQCTQDVAHDAQIA
jgi:hypothetical protein